jgi:hypothetical protein
MRRLKLLGQRLLVFGLGVLTIWLIAFVFFDFADRRLPMVVALAVTYGLSAYVILPRAIRTGLRILHQGRVPSYTLTGDGLPGDPVNLVLIGSRQQLRAAFEAAGWSQADPLSFASDWRMATAFVLNRSYPTAPFSTLYLFGRGQDVGFQQAIDNSPRKRHHVRFWGRPVDHAEQTLDSPGFWFNSDQPAENDRAMWVGAGTKDIGLSLTRLSFEITHATDADTNRERDWVVAELVRHGVVTDVRSHLAGERLTIGPVNRYVTDGMVAVADLSPEPPARPSS